MTQNVQPKWQILVEYGTATWTMVDLTKGEWQAGLPDNTEQAGFATTERGRKARITKAEHEIKASRSYAGESQVVLTVYHDDGNVTVFYGEQFSRLTRFARIKAVELNP